MTVEHRQALVARMFAEAEQKGQPLESDPRFRAWADQWATFEIDVAELKRRYSELLKEQSEAKRQRREARMAQFVRPLTAQGHSPEIETTLEQENSLEEALRSLDYDRDDASGRSSP
jgi:chromosome segregation ATPase